MRRLIQIGWVTVCLMAALSQAWGKTSQAFSSGRPLREPSSFVVVGPVTVVSISFLNLPFIKPYYVVKFKTDEGELIVVRHPGKSMPLLQGMRGFLTYSAYQEQILDFRLFGEN